MAQKITNHLFQHLNDLSTSTNQFVCEGWEHTNEHALKVISNKSKGKVLFHIRLTRL